MMIKESRIDVKQAMRKGFTTERSIIQVREEYEMSNRVVL